MKRSLSQPNFFAIFGTFERYVTIAVVLLLKIFFKSQKSIHPTLQEYREFTLFPSQGCAGVVVVVALFTRRVHFAYGHFAYVSFCLQNRKIDT
jgi:hypothetical protein